MPFYEYECVEHGAFDQVRPMSQSGEPAPCPVCQAASDRVITAPQVLSMSPIARDAAYRNEKSRHAPHVCGTGCSHSQKRPSQAAARAAATNIERTGKPPLQAYRGPRPWVVEHS